MKYKFKFYSENGQVAIKTLEELLDNNKLFNPLSFPISSIKEKVIFLGLKDANGNEIFDKDILELEITEELMETSFSNSNLAKAIKKQGDIKSAILIFTGIVNDLNTPYELYFVKENNKIDLYENGEFVCEAVSSDSMFPSYICCKGAKIIGNLVEEPDFLEKYR